MTSAFIPNFDHTPPRCVPGAAVNQLVDTPRCVPGAAVNQLVDTPVSFLFQCCARLSAKAAARRSLASTFRNSSFKSSRLKSFSYEYPCLAHSSKKVSVPLSPSYISSLLWISAANGFAVLARLPSAFNVGDGKSTGSPQIAWIACKWLSLSFSIDWIHFRFRTASSPAVGRVRHFFSSWMLLERL